MNNIKTKLYKAKEHLESLWFNICYIGIYWSQNYWLDIHTEEYQSDFDYKAVCVPMLSNLVNNSKPVSTSYEFEWGLIDIKDIRVWTETLVKCNPAYIETLYTDYCIYSDDYAEIINCREDLVSEMWVFLLKASYGMILEKQKAFSHPYPSIKDKIEKFGYDPKQLHHIIRLVYLMQHFVLWNGYKMKVNEKSVNELINIKLWKYSLEQAESLRDTYISEAKDIRDNYKAEPSFHTKQRIIDYSRKLIYNRIQNEIMDNKWHTL